MMNDQIKKKTMKKNKKIKRRTTSVGARACDNPHT